MLTDKGREAFDQAMALHAPWMNRLASDSAIADIEAMQRVLATLHVRLDAETANGDVA